MELTQLSKILGLESGQNSLTIRGISIDSRTIKPDECFIAIRGEHFDGHNFIADAKTQGACVAIVETACASDLPQLIVPDTQKALADIAAYHRDQFNPVVAAVTGSCGKTTVKEMIASIFSQQGKTFATRGNFNNHIGVPLSLLQLTSEHQYAIFELGASGAGEIAFTAGLVKPKVTLINNVSAAHIEGFGSLEGVAKAKGEIYDALPDDGTAIVNCDDKFADFWLAKLTDKTVMTFSECNEATEFHAQNILTDKHETRFVLVTPDDNVEISLPLPGKHNVRNAIAAAALSFACGMPLSAVQAGLAHVQQVAGRMQLRKSKSGARIFDDSYNANPSSVKAAIDTLIGYSGQRFLVLGDMAELGENADNYHREIGQYAKKAGIDKLYATGKLTALTCEAFGDNANFYVSHEDLGKALTLDLSDGVTCVVKGSRSAQMEKVVSAICDA